MTSIQDLKKAIAHKYAAMAARKTYEDFKKSAMISHNASKSGTTNGYLDIKFFSRQDAGCSGTKLSMGSNGGIETNEDNRPEVWNAIGSALVIIEDGLRKECERLERESDAIQLSYPS